MSMYRIIVGLIVKQAGRIDSYMSVEQGDNSHDRPRPLRRYTERDVEFLLQFPLGHAQDLSTEEPPDSGYINTLLPQATSIYEGPFYTQSSEPTCMPWSIANAMIKVGVSPPVLFMRDILDRSLGFNDQKQEGLHRTTALMLLNEHAEIPVTASFLRIYTPEDEGKVKDFFGKTYFPRSFSAIVQENASAIKDSLDDKAALVVSIKEEEKDNPHAITIGGYTISDRGAMTLQIIDPNHKVSYPKSIEKLTLELSRGGIFKVEKKIV